jgi:hypothetical protein
MWRCLRATMPRQSATLHRFSIAVDYAFILIYGADVAAPATA